LASSKYALSLTIQLFLRRSALSTFYILKIQDHEYEIEKEPKRIWNHRRRNASPFCDRPAYRSLRLSAARNTGHRPYGSRCGRKIGIGHEYPYHQSRFQYETDQFQRGDRRNGQPEREGDLL